MKKYTIIAGVALFTLTACTLSQQASLNKAAATTYGQLFCQFQAAGGGQAIVSVIDAAASAVPGAGLVAVLATGMAKDDVDAACAQAASNAGGSAGVPVSPPSQPVGSVAVNVTKS